MRCVHMQIKETKTETEMMASIPSLHVPENKTHISNKFSANKLISCFAYGSVEMEWKKKERTE